MNITVDYSFCCWPEADKLLNISLAKMGLFGISREWQFSVCKNRKPRASLCRASEGGHFIEGRGQEGWCNEQSRLFMGWVYAREAGVLPSSVADTGVTSCKSSPFSSVQFSSVAQSCLTLCDPMNRSTPGLPVHHRLPKFTQTHVIESVMPSSHLILCRPLLLLPSIFSSIRVFSNESALHIRWPKYWSFSFSISPSNEHPGLLSFRMDW